MFNKNKPPQAIDYFTQQPIVHPADSIETRPTQPGEPGYSPEGVAITALTGAVKEDDKAIGETDRKGSPAVIGNPDQYVGTVSSPEAITQDDLTGDVLLARSNGDIVEAKAMRAPAGSEAAYIVMYTVQGQTMRRLFKEGELEAMQSDIADQLANGLATVTRNKES